MCNAKILKALAERDIDFALPAEANFADTIETFDLDERTFRPGEQVERIESVRTFDGYRRDGGRGVGTRNFVVVLSVTSRTNGFARHAAEQAARRAPPGVDGVVAVTHTEGGGGPRPNNLDYVLRVLAGFMVHPNVGAVLAVDDGAGSYTSADLERFMAARGYPLDHVLHAFQRMEGGYETEVARAVACIDGWLPEVAGAVRTPEPAGALRLALQCGGSDAFSGVSGNALAGWVAKEVIRHGGSANLAETDELIGAEPYVLENVRDSATARRFLDKVENFKRYAANHGTTAEGNPSGGNNFRGLYNIALKSLGAARKKDPEVRLDYVIDYGQPMRPPGYYFMDSPGNDLESIAGQVASGSNLILFITGNGSITNFPFVPTLKFVTTTGRFELLANEMDVNAGRYNDGMEMDALGAETFELALDIASGQRSKGELAGTCPGVPLARVAADLDRRAPGARRSAGAGRAPAPGARSPAPRRRLRRGAHRSGRRHRSARPGDADQPLLGSGRAAHCRGPRCQPAALERRVALRRTRPHRRVRLGQRGRALPPDHARPPGAPFGAPRHPPRARMRADPQRCGAPLPRRAGPLRGPLRLGERADGRRHREGARQGRGPARGDGDRPRSPERGSVAGDAPGTAPASTRETVGAEELRIALAANGPVPDAMGEVFGRLAAGLVAAGATVVVPDNPGLLGSRAFRDAAFPDGASAPTASLAFGQPADERGFHVMETPTENPVETFTGLGATGVEIMLCHVGRTSLQAHPMIPLVQVTADAAVAGRYAGDLDRVLTLDRSAGGLVEELAALVADAASGRYRPRLWSRGVTEFQLTRGRLGLSM